MRIRVIVNPGAGQPEPVLSVLNQTLGEAGIEWGIDVTHASGDAHTAAREAADNAYDLIGVYGGDGTIKEVAAALAHGGPPMAILPGGTGNTPAKRLGIPGALRDAPRSLPRGATTCDRSTWAAGATNGSSSGSPWGSRCRSRKVRRGNVRDDSAGWPTR